MDREDLSTCVSDLRLYLHQRYGLPLKDARVMQTGERGVRGPVLVSIPRGSPVTVTVPLVDPASAENLRELRDILGDCKRCGLCEGRTHIVFGDGLPTAKLMIVGEAPGAEEDLQAKPFVGRSGQLLTKMLLALNLNREDVYITNVVKCRPPENRNPRKEEVASCAPFLLEQIRLVQPTAILALGTFAAQTLLQSDEPIMRLRGKSYTYAGRPLIVTLHPAACLYNPSNKKYVWEDIKGIPDMLKSAS